MTPNNPSKPGARSRVEKAPARGQRISRQPWKAWDQWGNYCGVFATKREALAAASRCGLIMIGSGIDTYDPLCELPEGHRGRCRSSAAIDQNRLHD